MKKIVHKIVKKTITVAAVLLTANITINAQCWKMTSVNKCDGWAYTLGVQTNGTIWAWGTNEYGKLGNGTTTDTLSPVQIGVDTNWIQVEAAGCSSSFGIKSNGTLWAWGETDSSYIPKQIGIATDWKILSGRFAIKNNGTLWNVYYTSTPTQIGVATNWQKIADMNSGYGIKTNGTFWDLYTETQIGIATTWLEISAGGYGVKNNGTLWNLSTETQIGTATNWMKLSGDFGLKSDGTLWDLYTQTQIGLSTNWKNLAANYSTYYTNGSLIANDGTLWAWGNSYTGNLGDGTKIDRPLPVQIGTACIATTIKATTNASSILLSPNPTTNKFIITGINLAELAQINVMDLAGKIVVQSSNLTVNIADLSMGTYLVSIKMNNDITTIHKLIKE